VGLLFDAGRPRPPSGRSGRCRLSFDPFTDEALADPYPQYHRLRAADPVHWSEKLRSWVILRHDDVVRFFRDDERLSSDRSTASKFGGPAPGVPLRTVSSDPPAHTPVRAMLNASLNPRVRAVGPRVDALIAALLDRLGAAVARAVERSPLAGEVDLIDDFAYPLPINVIAELLDVPYADRARFQEWSRAVARGMDRFFTGMEVKQGLLEIGAYFHGLVQERSGSGGDDLVRRLLGARHHGEGMTDLEVVAMCTALVFGGHETTVNLLGNGVLALLRDPAQLERLRGDPALIEPAVEELLRFDSPPQFVSRVVTTACDLRGKALRPGDSVLAGIGPANRDPAAFEDPDRLDLARTPNPHLAFGLGTHLCPGAQLSRLEVRAALPALLARLPRLALAGEPVRRRTIILRGLERLPVRLD
jgi:cytochrome P450